MNVLHAIHDFVPRHLAGSEIYAFELCRELASRHHVTVLAAEYDPARPHGHVTWRVERGLPVVELVNNWKCASFEDTYRPPRIGEQIAHVLDAVQPDIVHIHNLLNLSFDLPAQAKARGMAVVATLHDYTLVCPSGGQRIHRAERHLCDVIDVDRCARCFSESPFATQMSFAAVSARTHAPRFAHRLAVGLARRLPGLAGRVASMARQAVSSPVTPQQIDERLARAREVFDQIDLFVAPSQFLASEFEKLGVDPARMRVSDNGFAPLDGAATPTPYVRGPLRIGFVGTLMWHKGAHVLLDAVRQLPAHTYEVKLFGDPQVAPDYIADLRAQSTGLPVRFMGAFDHERVADVYAGIDVLVVPSLWFENSPLVIHEAFMAGVPVIGARIGGIPELVKDVENGLLYEATSAAALADILRRLIDQPGQLDDLRRRLPAVKPIAQDARDWEARYEEVLAGALEHQGALRTGALGNQGALRALRTVTPNVARPGSQGRELTVSVVIPTRNGAATVPGLLDMLGRQRVEFAFEIVAIDSGSTDGTVELLRPRVDQLIEIPAGAFDHGLTRNTGVEHARGDLVVLMVQDAVPLSEGWLAALTAPLLADSALAGTFARQQPRQNASAVTRHYLSRSIVASGSARLMSIAGHRALEALDPMARLIACTFDNVCSCLRKSVWDKHRFKATPMGEDIEWARDVLLAGHRLAYVPEAVVVHSHDRPARYEFDRTRTLHRRLYELFGLRTIPTVPALARSVGSSLLLHWRLEKSPRSIALAVAWPLGQYIGGLSAVRGWQPSRSRAV